MKYYLVKEGERINNLKSDISNWLIGKTVSLRELNFGEDNYYHLVKNKRINFVGLVWKTGDGPTGDGPTDDGPTDDGLTDDGPTGDGPTGDCLIVSIPKYCNIESQTREFTDDPGENNNPNENNGNVNKVKEWASKLVDLMLLFEKELEQKDDLARYSGEVYNDLIVAKKILKNYLDYGPIRHSIMEDHKSRGPINWGKTVDRLTPDYINNTPIYTKQIHTVYSARADEVTRLEESILYFLLDKYGGLLGSTLDLSEYYSEDVIRKEGKNRFIRLLDERRQFTFMDHELERLELMKEFIIQSTSSYYDATKVDERISVPDKLKLYAVMNFDVIFELLIGRYFGNSIYINRSTGKPKVFIKSEYVNREIYLHEDNIRPYHILGENNDDIDVNGENGIGINIIDVAFEGEFEIEGVERKNCCFVIDVKNYSKKIGDKYFYNQRSINEAVYKQFFYRKIIEAAYKNNIHNPNISIYNLFLLPKYNWDTLPNGIMKYFGRIEFNEVAQFSKDDSIHLLKIDVDEIIKAVLKSGSRKHDIENRRAELVAELNRGITQGRQTN